MALEQLNFKGQNKVEFAIDLLRLCEPVDGYQVNISGGVDSDCVATLVRMAEVKHQLVYCVSPIDPPQVRHHLKMNYPQTRWEIHAKGFWDMVIKEDLPLRTQRWCCRVIKEASGDGTVLVTGVRRDEGNKRRGQCFIGEHRDDKRDIVFIRPIIYWTKSDVWDFIRRYNIPYCSLYDEGAKPSQYGYGKGIFKRLGCVLCPFSRDVERDTLYFPKIVANWKRACDRIVEDYKARNYISKKGKPMKRKFQTGEELYQWWVSRK